MTGVAKARVEGHGHSRKNNEATIRKLSTESVHDRDEVPEASAYRDAAHAGKPSDRWCVSGMMLRGIVGLGHSLPSHSAPVPANVRFAPLEHFPAKWEPVRRRKCDQIRNLERVSDSIESERTLATKMLWRRERNDVQEADLLLPMTSSNGAQSGQSRPIRLSNLWHKPCAQTVGPSVAPGRLRNSGTLLLRAA